MPVSALFLIAASASLGALPEGVTARVRIEPAVIPFHQPSTYTVELEVPAGTSFQMPSMMGRFDGLSAPGGVQQREEPLKDGGVRITETYQLEAVFPGNYAIEPAVVTISGTEYAVPSPVLTVRELTEEEVAIAEKFDAALPEFDPSVAAPFYLRAWFWAAILAAVALVGLAGFALRRRSMAAIEPPKTAWEIALARLEALRGRDLARKREFDRYYVDLSAILRYYIEARFDLHAPERTTQEFLQEMAAARLFDEHQETFLASFLKHCDYVKFARLEPLPNEMAERFDQVVRFVNETIPAPSAESAAQAA